MNLSVEPGKYVVAVSGGVDSIVLLDLLAKVPHVKLIVAHFDHGIRPDSGEDAVLVADLANKYGLPVSTARVDLRGASEAKAREARYKFLRWVQAEHDATAIITAHHQDDLLETAIHNLLRGTGRRGLASLKSTDTILRPLLAVSKSDILAYATKQKLSWHEDTTNHDERYTRNYIRHRLLVRFNTGARQQLLALISRQSLLNEQIDQGLEQLLVEHSTGLKLDRRWFCTLPHDVSKEVIASWLRQHKLADFDRTVIERLTVGAKVMRAGKQLDIMHGSSLIVSRDYLALSPAER
ncbi:hypothetical protein BH09PAT3_BH09PAT3_0590 [soil metagenome]